jgi:UDP-N-acetylglucosamine 2-epimerase
MLDQILHAFDIKPDYDLDIMKDGQTVTDITINSLSGLEWIFKAARPDMALVHGDTTTTLAGALAAFYNGVKLGHVEAGLRTYDKTQPYPEEMNRSLTARLADAHFAPTATAKANLLKENISSGAIFVTGNTAIDAIKTTTRPDYVFAEKQLNDVDFSERRVIAMTAHRRENLGKPLEDICRAVKDIANRFDDVEVVYAVHKNPAVLDIARKILGDCPRVRLTPPLDLNDMHNLMARSYMVMTDSGGLQEEALELGKPTLVLRNVTERPEGIATGALKLCGVNASAIISAASELLSDRNVYDKMRRAKNPFGDGFAARRIVKAILFLFGASPERPEDFV